MTRYRCGVKGGAEWGRYRLVLVRAQSDELAVGKVWREGLLSMSRIFVWSVARVVRDWESVRVVVGRVSGSLHLLARC
jgi:hypothetical protein